jgi:peptidoglycan/xylan/chitin deacetylase (PgdA/CDA1 family)
VVVPSSLISQPAVYAVDDLLESFDVTGDWTASSGSVASDTTNIKEGTQSLRVSSDAGGYGIATKTTSLDLSTASNFQLWFYVHDISKLRYVRLYLSSTTDFSKYFLISLSSNYAADKIGNMHTGWNNLSLVKSDFTNTGEEDWANTMIRMRVRISALPGEVASVSFDNFRKDSAYGAKIILTFDDCLESQYTHAYPILSANGQKGVICTVTGSVGGPGFISLADLTTLAGAGWDISSHTVNHLDLTTLSPEDLAAELGDSMDWLVSHGFGATARYISYPVSNYNDTVISATIAAGYNMARTGDAQIFFGHIFPDNNAEYMCKARILQAGITPDIIEGYIDPIRSQDR